MYKEKFHVVVSQNLINSYPILNGGAADINNIAKRTDEVLSKNGMAIHIETLGLFDVTNEKEKEKKTG